MNGTEAEVWIDGVRLTDAQACTVRVALSSFLMGLDEMSLGPIAKSYEARGREVERLLVDGGNRPDRLARRRSL